MTPTNPYLQALALQQAGHGPRATMLRQPAAPLSPPNRLDPGGVPMPPIWDWRRLIDNMAAMSHYGLGKHGGGVGVPVGRNPAMDANSRLGGRRPGT